MTDRNAFGGARILVVEDDVLVAAELVNTLHAMGADVIGPVENIDKALERLDRPNGFAGPVLDINVQGHVVFPLRTNFFDAEYPSYLLPATTMPMLHQTTNLGSGVRISWGAPTTSLKFKVILDVGGFGPIYNFSGSPPLLKMAVEKVRRAMRCWRH